MIGHLLDKWIRLEIQTDPANTKNNLGTPKVTYEFLKDTKAGVQFVGGTSQKDDKGENAVIDAIFTIRYDERVNYKCRVYYLGQYYSIQYIEPIGRKEGIRLKTIMFVNE